MQRRQFIAAGSSLLLASFLPLRAFANPQPRPAFAATTLDEALKALGADKAAATRDIQITAPDVAEDGSVVPLAVQSGLAGTEALSILVEKNRTQLIARFTLPEGTQANINTRIKMSEGSRVLGVAHTKAGVFSAAREVKVTQGGCGPGDPSGRAPEGAAPQPTRIRATVTGGETEVKVLMSHDMETGQRRDAAGALVPAHYITDVRITHNGRDVLVAQFGTGVSRNPFLHFRFKGGAKGDKLRVDWTDNKGRTRSDEAALG
ncbi:MAG: thiosulfate oxidation carrier protein SoxY [Methyloversatilis sp.]|nr:thiosulfate oxidation carrier protein SoxY [Methyloversatilis sp.]